MIKRSQAIGTLVLLSMVADLIFSSDLQANAKHNLVNDHRLYAYSEYRAKRQYDHTLQIRVTRDLRAQAEYESQEESMRATDDAFWMYPAPEMLERILFREFALSFLFRKVSRKDTKSDLILEVVLKSFHARMQRAGFVTRLIDGHVALSANLVQQKPRKTLFAKEYDRQTRVKLKPITKSEQHMVKQVGRCLEEIVPVLISDIEKVLEEMTPRKKTRKSPTQKPKKQKSKKQKPKPLNLEPVGPK